jgi:mRNA interferase MazF
VPYLRSQVVFADLGHGAKPWVVVSNNQRNASRKGDFVALRVTTSPIRHELPTIVRLAAADRPLIGAVLCDDPYVLDNNEVERTSGALSPSTMRAVDEAIRIALAV